MNGLAISCLLRGCSEVRKRDLNGVFVGPNGQVFHEEWKLSTKQKGRCILLLSLSFLLLLLYTMRTLPIWKTFSILIIIFHSRAYSTFSNNEASSPSAFSYDAELEPLVLGPDRAALSIYSHEAESHPGSLVAASDDLNSSDFAGEDQADYNNGGRTEIIRNGYDECTPKNRRNRSKMRVRQLSCPFERMQNSKGPATGQGQRIRTAPGRKVEPDQMPEIEPYIPLQILKSDEETCLPATTGKGNFYSASNTPVCSTGLDQIKFPPTSRPQYFTLQECFPCK